MLLYVFIDGTCKQVEDNISVADMLAVKQGLLKIVKWHKGQFVYLVQDESKLLWVPIKKGFTISCPDARVHQ